MPIEVLTKEEVEKIVEEKTKKLNVGDLVKKIAQFESSIKEFKDNFARLSTAGLKA